MTPRFPFSAITGQQQAKKALLCALASDEIRSILITGNCGTGKSVLARSLETIVPGKRLLNLPLNVTNDRLLGSIDMDAAVSTGVIRHSPGILEQANRHILYADDINLMDEGAVTSLLNTAETGEVICERESISHRARTQFLLVATMNPAEGELSPAQMDRFDLCIGLDSIGEEEMRGAIIRNQLVFEREPETLSRHYGEQESALTKTVAAARDRLPYVSIPEGHAGLIASVCLELGVAGQRGDLAAARAAKALAALDSRDSVEFDDIKLATLFALEHRRREIPDAPPPVPPQNKPPKQDNEREQEKNPPEPDQSNPPQEDPDTQPETNQERDPEKKKNLPPPLRDQIFAIGSPFEVIRYLNESSQKTTRKQKSGRRTRVISSDASGHYRSFRFPGKNRHDIAIDATLRAAAPYQCSREKHGLAISVRKTDLREKVREKKTAHTILFLVDASGSMGARKRMVAVKGAIVSLLTDAYQKRDRVGMMVFRGSGSRLLLPPTKSPDLAIQLLQALPTGGMTPLTQGLADAFELLTRGRFASSDENRSIVILSDGRVNVSWKDTRSPYEELRDLARNVSESDIRFVVVDTEEGFPRLGRARALAGDLGATYFRLEALCSRHLAGAVQGVVYQGGRTS
ncbi:VWA domain-containing protein [Methanoregula sp.]|uniref:VWA domain-containing protein n=1 Tax=Methanoregula sp. TaxID=2052170 RepID=UPI00260EC142|nr:VWA domain-containing protein [Methanoregula sp.]MDD5144195.1 VWA domain-containing protein [Methanoregula sp.]